MERVRNATARFLNSNAKSLKVERSVFDSTVNLIAGFAKDFIRGSQSVNAVRSVQDGVLQISQRIVQRNSVGGRVFQSLA